MSGTHCGQKPHAVGIHGCAAQFFNELVIDNQSYHGADTGDELCHLRQVDIIAVLLLKIAPVELVDIFRQFFFLQVPVLHLQKNFNAVLLAAEGQLENVEDIIADLKQALG